MSNFVTIETEENKIKLKNLFFIAIFIWFTWIVFHFTIVFFFWLVLESVFLVGLFLWLWNIVSMILDIPIWVLQKYIKPKTFLLIASSFMFLVSLIFLKFIYFKGISWVLPGWDSDTSKTISYLWEFLNSGLNIFLLIFAACLYGIIKECYDVTTLSYIFNNSTPSEYATLISKYNIHTWQWSMIWLVFSWILLAFDIKIAIIVITIIILAFLWIISKYFDNSKETFEFWQVKKLKLDVLKTDFLKKKDELISNISTGAIIELSKQTKVILLKPIEIKRSINFKEVFDVSVVWFKTFIKIIFGLPRNLLVIWFLAVIIQYGFWDTFVSTFQVQFLEKIIGLNKEEYLIKQSKWILSGYVLLWLIVIPAFLLQEFFINLSKKLWVYKVVMFWLWLSSVSLFFFWIFQNIYTVVLLWLLNSVWYAASMPLAQAVFWWLYNEDYARKFNLKEIDSTVSAAPIKILLNFANVIWLVIWAILVWTLWFDGFFIFFSFILWIFFVYSIIHKKDFSAATLEEDPWVNKAKLEAKLALWELKKEIDPDFV